MAISKASEKEASEVKARILLVKLMAF
jgi:hypothetical protein